MTILFSFSVSLCVSLIFWGKREERSLCVYTCSGYARVSLYHYIFLYRNGRTDNIIQRINITKYIRIIPVGAPRIRRGNGPVEYLRFHFFEFFFSSDRFSDSFVSPSPAVCTAAHNYRVRVRG